MDAPRETHQFDFWLGSWKVFDPEDRLVGTNRISALFGGLALMEEWEGNGAVSGRSLNSWDAGREAWHQTWMDSSGSTLLLDGGLQDGSMVMEGSAPSGSGRAALGPAPDHLDPLAGPELRFASSGRRRTTTALRWTVAFDGRYRRA